MKKKLIAAGAVIIGCFALAGCTDAPVVNHNLTKDAENFKVERRIVFVNGITDKYLLSIEGKCNIDDDGNQLEVICKTGENQFKKQFLGLSNNVTYFAEQLEPITEDPFHYRVQFKPETILPDLEVRASGND